MKGTVKTKTDRGFGFIGRDGEQKDLFFHAKDLEGVTFDELQVGEPVIFEIVDGPKGPSAKNVKRAGDADTAPAMETEEVVVEGPAADAADVTDEPAMAQMTEQTLLKLKLLRKKKLLLK
jgi:cold shock protein